jgi:3-oxosteroid 1-dehydrogenase
VRLGGDGAIIGATVRTADQVADVTASAVIIGAGGFDRNPELRSRFLPAPVAATGAAPGNTGDGLRVAVKAGAHLENTGQGWWMPMIEIPGLVIEGKQYYQSVIRERALPRQIMVNQAGRRFTDEALPYNELGKVMNQPGPAGDYPNGTAWMLFDDGFRRRDSFPLPG